MNRNMIYMVPLFSEYQVLPNAYTRMIGGRAFVSHICEKLLQLSGDIRIVTDIPEVMDLINDKAIKAEIMDLELFVRRFNRLGDTMGWSITNNNVIVIINPNAPMLSVETIRNVIKTVNLMETKSSQACLSPITDGFQTLSDFKIFMTNNSLLVIEFTPNNDALCFNLTVPENEGLIISGINDWILADRLMKRKRVIFRADGYAELGMGHIYNCITLAYSMFEHEVLIVLTERSKEGIQKVKEAQLPYKVVYDNDDMKSLITDFKPDVWVNDCLDTDKDYIDFLKSKVQRVVTIEDLGSGAKRADAVINALYDENMLSGSNVYSGWEYVCLREEFQIEARAAFSEKVRRILVMFGGTDPSNYNRTLYPIIKEIAEQYPDIEFDFIVGIGYDAEANGVVTIEEKRIYVYPNVQRVSKYMKTADIAITSQGRTIFELAAMGVPAIVLSQNERETKHKFAQMENGFLNLGAFKDVDSRILKNTLDWLINTPKIRKNMYDLMKKYPLRSGLKRVRDIILGY